MLEKTSKEGQAKNGKTKGRYKERHTGRTAGIAQKKIRIQPAGNRRSSGCHQTDDFQLGVRAGAPALDKAAELAGIYRISLDELAGNFQGSHETAKERKDLHILKKLTGKKCRLEYLDQTEAAIDDLLRNTQVRILDVNECWMRIEYERRREGTFRQKETVVKLVELSKITGAVLTVETEVENG